MMSDSEVELLIGKYKPYLLGKNNEYCRKSIIGQVISVPRKVYCVAHSDLNESEVSRGSIFDRFRDKITYHFCERFVEKKSVVVYASPAKICSISESMTPTTEDLNILAGEGIEYDDIKWSVEKLEFGSWIGAARSYNVTFSGFTQAMSVMSEDVIETVDKAAITSLHQKNPATGRTIKPAHMLKRNQRHREEVAGAVVEDLEELEKDQRKKICP